VRVCFTEDGWDDYRHWVEADHVMLVRINTLIEDARRNLFKGLGKPEPLRGDLSGWWSRRISGEHRLVYRITGKVALDQRIEIAMCRQHYN
jgi:toxin YoeB